MTLHLTDSKSLGIRTYDNTIYNILAGVVVLQLYWIRLDIPYKKQSVMGVYCSIFNTFLL